MLTYIHSTCMYKHTELTYLRIFLRATNGRWSMWRTSPTAPKHCLIQSYSANEVTAHSQKNKFKYIYTYSYVCVYLCMFVHMVDFYLDAFLCLFVDFYACVYGYVHLWVSKKWTNQAQTKNQYLEHLQRSAAQSLTAPVESALVRALRRMGLRVNDLNALTWSRKHTIEAYVLYWCAVFLPPPIFGQHSAALRAFAWHCWGCFRHQILNTHAYVHMSCNVLPCVWNFQLENCTWLRATFFHQLPFIGKGVNNRAFVPTLQNS